MNRSSLNKLLPSDLIRRVDGLGDVRASSGVGGFSCYNTGEFRVDCWSSRDNLYLTVFEKAKDQEQAIRKATIVFWNEIVRGIKQ